MRTSALWWLGGGAAAWALGYWQVVLAEGAYLGPWAVRLVYALGARHYERVRAASQPAADAVLLPLLHAAVAGLPHPRVLDVATGTGRVPLLLQAEPTFNGILAGLDLTPQMLAVARERAAVCATQASPEMAPPPFWHLGEAGNLPWCSGVFDLVTCLEALEYFPHPRRALAELVRVARPGAPLLISKVPDTLARLLPGRAFTRRALTRLLATLGCAEVTILPWQPGHYELVAARAGTYVL